MVIAANDFEENGSRRDGGNGSIEVRTNMDGEGIEGNTTIDILLIIIPPDLLSTIIARTILEDILNDPNCRRIDRRTVNIIPRIPLRNNLVPFIPTDNPPSKRSPSVVDPSSSSSRTDTRTAGIDAKKIIRNILPSRRIRNNDKNTLDRIRRGEKIAIDGMIVSTRIEGSGKGEEVRMGMGMVEEVLER